MNAKHTPGPFHANGALVYEKTGRAICTVHIYYGDERGEPEVAANAALFAAAPELLEALKELRLEYHHILGTDASKRQHAINARAETAIAKAEGR